MTQENDARFILYNAIKANSENKGFKRRAKKDFYYKLPESSSRDPETLATLVNTIVEERGWKASVDAGSLFSDWESYVGKQNAQFTSPVSFNNGFLVVKCDSTARTAQMRLIEYDFISTINKKLAGEMVKKIKFIGPQAPSWRKGVRHIKGRGPRDTYG
ncbi:MAG: DciA family protein [Micrococcaceae bacterium]